MQISVTGISAFLWCSIFLFSISKANAERYTSKQNAPAVQNDSTKTDSANQRDMIDVLTKMFKKKGSPVANNPAHKFILSVVPAVGYSLSTGFLADLTASATFYTQKNLKQNISFINFKTSYDSRSQISFVTESSIRADDDKLRFVTDLRLLKFPDDTYGLGSFSTNADDDPIVYNYFRFYETFFRSIAPDLFLGGGYNLDKHFSITEKGTLNGRITDFDRYGFSNASISSGFNLALLFDTRRNPINPQGGTYVNLVMRQNTKWLGSDTQWGSVQLDMRKYYKLSATSKNILAFWSIVWFDYKGNAPYLDLPATGWDTFNNMGRGYVVGRFRGTGLLYLESEYRFGLTKNGLLGGVLFANGQSLNDYPDGGFKRIIPAIGTGIRVKVNKKSNTNLSLDYAYGFQNSKGLFLNLGEVF